MISSGWRISCEIKGLLVLLFTNFDFLDLRGPIVYFQFASGISTCKRASLRPKHGYEETLLEAQCLHPCHWVNQVKEPIMFKHAWSLHKQWLQPHHQKVTQRLLWLFRSINFSSYLHPRQILLKVEIVRHTPARSFSLQNSTCSRHFSHIVSPDRILIDGSHLWSLLVRL